MPDENGAIWISNNNYFPGREGHQPRYICLHGTAGGSSAQETAQYFLSTQGSQDPVSSNYIIDQQGVIVQCVNERDGAWAQGDVSGVSGISGSTYYGNGQHDIWWNDDINPNNLIISIEHVKPDINNTTPLTAAQQRSSFLLIQHICQRHNIPMRKADATGGITGHYAIDPVNRPDCPGAYPWTELFTFLATGETMTTLEGFPMKSQLADVSEMNKLYDCVPTSIAAALQWLMNKPFDGGAIKDTVYGATYQGGTAPERYIGYCAQQGVLLTPMSGNNTALVQSVKQQLAAGYPVLLTEIDPYMPASSGYTHVVVAYACNDNSITVMDPYIDQPVTKTDQQWESDLQYNQIWILEKVVEENIVLQIEQASEFFVEAMPNEVWHCKQTGYDVSHGILQYYRTCTNAGLNGLSMFGLPTGPEEPVPGIPGCTIQRFERGCIAYDPINKLDRVPGISGPCYPAHIDKAPGQDPRIAALMTEQSQLVNQLHQAQQNTGQFSQEWITALIALRNTLTTLQPLLSLLPNENGTSPTQTPTESQAKP